MICPNCKNEKWEKDVCPVCGLAEWDAWEAVGVRAHSQGRFPQAVAAYEKVLESNPHDPGAARGRALSLAAWAETTSDPELFERAQAAFSGILEADWGWMEGHQVRLRLHQRSGRLEELLEKYRTSGPEGDGEPIRAEMIRVLELTRKFAAVPPAASTSFSGWKGWKSGTVPVLTMIGAALLFWWGLSLLHLARARGMDGENLLLPAGLLVLSGAFLVLYSAFKFRRGPGRKGSLPKSGDP